MEISDFAENVNLSEHTSFRVGGPARYFFEAKTKKEIIGSIETAKKNSLPFCVISGGTNVLAPDKGYDGLVIKIKNNQLKAEGSKITVGAGMLFQMLVREAEKNSLSGLEWAAGIPGCVGGAVYGNAQAFGENISDSLKEVEVFDIASMGIKRLTKQECEYSEKDSIFKRNKNLIILQVTFELKKGNKEEIKKIIEEHIKIRKGRHPLEFPSAGSVFVNEEGREPSSMLIEKCGLKGKRVGNAQVSEKHAGFIVNLGGATSKDILELIEIIKKEVKQKTGFELKEEIQIIQHF